MAGKLKLDMTLKKLIAERKISTRELARITGVPQATISNFLSGGGSSKPEHIRALAKYFGTSMEFLLFGEDDREPTLSEVQIEEVFEGWLHVKINKAIPTKKK